MKKKKSVFMLISICVLLMFSTVTASAGTWKKNNIGWWYQEGNNKYPANQWKLINGKWYWFNKNGYMATGWQKISGKWYYLQNNGAMLGQGWHKIGNKWYYMYSSGALAVNTWVGNYYVDGNGVWIQGKTKTQVGWIKSGNKWWYRHADGSYKRNGWEQIEGSWYFFDESGWMVTGWRYVKGSWYYLQPDGAMLGQGWHMIDGDWYYMYSNGSMAVNTWIGEYFVNSSGVRIDTSNGIYLLDVIKPYSTPYHYEECISKSFKMGGTSYKNGFTCMGYGDEGKGNLTYFNLNGQYKELLFTAGILDQNFIGSLPEKVTFRVIADGKEVDSFTMRYGSLPISRKVNINKCKQLIISVYSYCGTAFYDGYYGVAELKVKK